MFRSQNLSFVIASLTFLLGAAIQESWCRNRWFEGNKTFWIATTDKKHQSRNDYGRRNNENGIQKMQIKIMQNLLDANEKKATEIRELLKQKNIFMINLVSSPGSGKTSLLEKTLPLLKNKYRVAIIEADLETNKDAKRLEQYDVPIALINTKGGCHLKSISIEKALSSLDLDSLDLIFIENVGNLVCPAAYDLGENTKVAILSTPEGDDKPMKYPLLFQETNLVLLNKIDLLEHVDFNLEVFYDEIKHLNGNSEVIEISCKKEFGINQWIKWLEEHVAVKR